MIELLTILVILIGATSIGCNIIMTLTYYKMKERLDAIEEQNYKGEERLDIWNHRIGDILRQANANLTKIDLNLRDVKNMERPINAILDMVAELQSQIAVIKKDIQKMKDSQLIMY